jgi:hypothetical protein
MADPVTLTRSRTYPVPLERTYERTLSIPLEQIFAKRYGLIPPVTKTEGDDPWGTPGQTRVVTTADGGQMREELLTAEPPNRFTYRLTDVQGPLRRLIDSIDGTWSFEAVGSGSRVTWTWVVHPTTSPLVRPGIPVLTKLWNGYARQSLDHLEELLLAG